MGVCSEPPSPGRGREAAVSAATSERAEQLSNFDCAAPLPRAAGPGAALLRLGAPAPGPAGDRPGYWRVGEGWAGAAGVAQLPRGKTGCASMRPKLRNDARSRSRARPPRPPPGGPGSEEGGGGWRRSHGNCAGWINKERAARGRRQAASISAADAASWEARPSSPKFFLPPRIPLWAREGGRRLGSQALVRRKAGGGDQPWGREEGCEVVGKGECEGDLALRGSSAVCSRHEARREALAGPARPENLGEPPDPASRKVDSSSSDFQKRLRG